MKDKIKRYARILWKYRWAVFFVVCWIVLTVTSHADDFGFGENLFYSGIWAAFCAGVLWFSSMYVRFTISYCKDIIDLNKYLDEATFEDRYKREVERRRRKAEKRMRLKKKIQMLRNRL